MALQYASEGVPSRSKVFLLVSIQGEVLCYGCDRVIDHKNICMAVKNEKRLPSILAHCNMLSHYIIYIQMSLWSDKNLIDKCQIHMAYATWWLMRKWEMCQIHNNKAWHCYVICIDDIHGINKLQHVLGICECVCFYNYLLAHKIMYSILTI